MTDLQFSTKRVSKEASKKLGYCGHCGFYDYLPFREEVTQLRNPYQTRSGYIYGPIRRFLKLPEFLKTYSIR